MEGAEELRTLALQELCEAGVSSVSGCGSPAALRQRRMWWNQATAVFESGHAFGAYVAVVAPCFEGLFVCTTTRRRVKAVACAMFVLLYHRRVSLNVCCLFAFLLRLAVAHWHAYR